MFLQLVAQLFVQFKQEAFVADERGTGDNPTAKYANVNYAFENETGRHWLVRGEGKERGVLHWTKISRVSFGERSGASLDA